MIPNLRAFLEVIASCEGTAYAEGYRALFGWRPGRDELLFDSYADHPRVRTYEKADEFIANGVRDYTTAAGRYQITETTWMDFIRAVGPRDFSPPAQDECAAWLVERNGAMEDVEAGNLEAALKKCAGTWASLPGSPYGQPMRSLAYCKAVFARALDTQPAAPIEDRSTPARPQDIPAEQPKEDSMGFIAPLLLSLASGFAPVLQQQLTKALGTKNEKTAADLTTQLVGIVQGIAAGALPPQPTPESSTPVPVDPKRIDPVVAVGMVKADAKLLAQAEEQFSDRIAMIMPAINELDEMSRRDFLASEDSRDRAATRAKVDGTEDQDRLLTISLVVMAGAVLGVLAIGIIVLGIMGKSYGELLTLFAAGVGMVWNKFGTRVDYRYGSSAQSKAKDVMNAQLLSETVRSRQ